MAKRDIEKPRPSREIVAEAAKHMKMVEVCVEDFNDTGMINSANLARRRVQPVRKCLAELRKSLLAERRAKEAQKAASKKARRGPNEKRKR